MSPVADQVVESLQNIEYETMNVGWASEEMATMSTRSFRNLIFGAQMSLFYTSMLASGMLRSESSTIAVDMAQDHYNETVAKYGANSSQAQRAMDSLNRSQLLLQRNMTVTNIMMVSMGLQFVGMAVQISSTAIPSLATLTGMLHGVANAAREVWAALGPLGWAILAGGAIAGGVATAYAAGAFNVNLPNTLTVNNTTNTNDVINQYAARLKKALNQSGVP